MFQVLTTATPTINDWSRLPEVDQSDLGGACADDEAEDDEYNENEHQDSNPDLPNTTKAVLGSVTPNTTADPNNDNQIVIQKKAEFASMVTSSRVRDPRRAPLGVISEGISVDHVSEDVDGDVSSDMAQLKATTARLKLATRRPSYVAWQAHVQERPKNPPSPENLDNDVLTEERKSWITNSIQWITEELTDMRHQDQDLARQLLTIRQEIQRIKLDMSCDIHEDMLADVQLEMEELEELSDICDRLPPMFHDNPLRHLGVTRMNISARRFSTC